MERGIQRRLKDTGVAGRTRSPLSLSHNSEKDGKGRWGGLRLLGLQAPGSRRLG